MTRSLRWALRGPLFAFDLFQLTGGKNGRLPFLSIRHHNVMHSLEYQLRIPSEPEPFPIKEPPDPPENPDMPVREPDPEQPSQI